jgi:hypothetical protein
MGNYKDVGFAKALARELYVHNYKEYGSPVEAAEDAVSFMKAISVVLNNNDTHTPVISDGPNQS